jgi:molybdate transport system substrate-binding protein
MRVVAALLSCAVAGAAAATDIRVLSAGAVEPGLVKVADQFRRETNNRVRIQFFAATPQLERRLSVGDAADVLVAPAGLMNDQLRRGKVDAEAHSFIGRVGLGVAVRAAAPDPDIATLDRFKQSLLSADSIVYNQASSGLYLEKLFDLLGIAEQLRTKTTRYANSAQVLEHVIGGKGNEIGFAAITEIRQFEPKGLRLVGPLPEQVQNSTAYSAAVMTDAPEAEIATDFVRYIGTPAAKAAFSAAGID